MDLSAKDDDLEPFFHLSSSSGAPPRRAAGDKKQVFDFSADDVLPAYDFQPPTQQQQHQHQHQQRRANTLEQGSTSSSRRHRSSGSPPAKDHAAIFNMLGEPVF